jgi:glutamine synthetase type III
MIEQYIKLLRIESRTLQNMVRTAMLPCAMRFQAELADTIGATQNCGVECPEPKLNCARSSAWSRTSAARSTPLRG